jgi:DeoR/GlpR family transcriptional regulator of sugar metabolism
MIGIADEVFLLADYTKFGVRAFSLIASCDQVHHLITDGKGDSEMLRRLEERGLKMTISK